MFSTNILYTVPLKLPPCPKFERISLQTVKYYQRLRQATAIALEFRSVGNVKSVPLQAWSGPEDSRKLRFPDFMTTAQEGGKVVSLTHRPPLPPGNPPGTHFC